MTNRQIVELLMGRMVVAPLVYGCRHDEECPSVGVRRLVRKWVEVENLVTTPGWVVGVKWLQTGYTVYDHDQACFRETATRTKSLLICYWPGRLPVPVPIHCVEPVVGVDRKGIHPPEWHDDARALMRQGSRRRDRDPRGRFK